MKKFLFLSFLFSLTNLACSQQDGQMKQNTSKKNPKIEDYIFGEDYDQYEVATFAGGCFWCTEAALDRINGVIDVISGYSGGHIDHPTYYQIGSGKTGHAEAIQIYFDPKVVSYEKLLEVFFVAHDPTQLNRQGPDTGPQYRSAVFYHNETQKELTKEAIKHLDDSGKFNRPIVTEVTLYEEFWVAEEYHQNFYELNPTQPYVRSVSKPKVEKVEKYFADILKDDYRKN